MIKNLFTNIFSNQYTNRIKNFLKTKYKSQPIAKHSNQIIYDADISTFDQNISLLNKPLHNYTQEQLLGVDEVLTKLRWNNINSSDTSSMNYLHLVSTSYPNILLQKNNIKNKIDWASITLLNTIFKNQLFLSLGLSNLKRDLLLKSMVYLNIINQNPNTNFLLLGNDFKLDSFIFITLYLLSKGYLDPNTLIKYLEQYFTGLNLNEFIEELNNFKNFNLKHMLILKPIKYTKISNTILQHIFSSLIFYFDNYLEVALYCISINLIDPQELWPLVRSFHNKYNFSLKQIIFSIDKLKFIFKYLSNSALDNHINEIKNKIINASSSTLEKSQITNTSLNILPNSQIITQVDVKEAFQNKEHISKLYTEWIQILFNS